MNRFAAGFLLGLLAFAAANVIWHFYRSSPPGVMGGVQYYGFPFAIWTRSGINPPMSIAAPCYDTAIALGASLAIGFTWRRHGPA